MVIFMIIGRKFEFEASHYLPPEKIYGKCSRLHGHRYELQIEILGELRNEGWICNFTEIKEIVDKVIMKKYDHSNLNDYFDIPTVEIVAQQIFNELDAAMKEKTYSLFSVKLFETSQNYVMISKNQHLSCT